MDDGWTVAVMTRSGMLKEIAAMFRQSERASQYRLSGSCTQTDDNLGLNKPQFGFQPRAAGLYLRCLGLFVNAAFSPFFEFEVLYGVGDVDIGAIDPGLLQSTI